jgi:tetratricopeptide (TPR) repeat protein
MAIDDDTRQAKDPLEDYLKRKVKELGIPKSTKDDLQAMMTSHLRRGEVLRFRGLLHEALEEFEKEKDRPINAPIDAEIVESAFWQMSKVYRQLGEVENAIAAYEKALELFRQYGVGVSPHEGLAELYLKQHRVDEAIALCQECLERWPSSRARQLLARAMAIRSGDSEQRGN